MQNIIELALSHLKQGHLIAIPTETVYGLACDPDNPTAIQKLFSLKKRPLTQPLAVLLPEQSHVLKWASEFPEPAQRLANAFWPGPLTLVLPKQPHVSDTITAGKPSIGLRMPDHPITLALLEQFNSGIPASSANLSKQTSPTDLATVQKTFRSQVDHFVEGGPCKLGIGSSIVAFEPNPILLREGALSKQVLEQILKMPIGSKL